MVTNKEIEVREFHHEYIYMISGGVDILMGEYTYLFVRI